ncbi:hypothetical protein OAN22_00450 [Alphaproteobacteria bacterium]|nr:hypothetical protein [Alphaproteobacteria bacterium]
MTSSVVFGAAHQEPSETLSSQQTTTTLSAAHGNQLAVQKPIGGNGSSSPENQDVRAQAAQSSKKKAEEDLNAPISFGPGDIIDSYVADNLSANKISLFPGVIVKASLERAKSVAIHKDVEITEELAGHLRGVSVRLFEGSVVTASLEGVKRVAIEKGVEITEELAGFLKGVSVDLL